MVSRRLAAIEVQRTEVGLIPATRAKAGKSRREPSPSGAPSDLPATSCGFSMPRPFSVISAAAVRSKTG